MIDLTGAELAELIESCDLFQEFLQLPDADRYRQALRRSRAWRLQRGELLPQAEMAGAAYAVLSGRAVPYDPARAGGEAEAFPRIFGQWAGLRGLEPAETPMATEPTVLFECARDLLDLLLGRGLASQFQVEFYLPFLQGVEPIADTPPEILESVARRARFITRRDGEAIVRTGDYGSTMFFVLAGSAVIPVPGGQRITLRRGDFFGELAVLTYQPRTTTITAQGDCLVMECDRNIFGDLRKKSKTFKEVIEKIYRERAMLSLLQSTPIFQGMEAEELKAICEIATLESFDPYEPIFFQGDPADALYIVVNGTMTVVQEQEAGALPIAWIRPGQTVGEMALLSEIGGSDRRGQTVASLQRVDAIRIPGEAFQQLLAQHRFVRQRLANTVMERSDVNARIAQDTDRSTRLGWILETEHLAGQWVLAVDMDDCIRCGNCVTACEQTHGDGISRFFWSDMRQDEDVMPHVRLSNSCQHCEFALCMRVCPTHAIERDEREASVFIDYDKCIRCGKCADPSQGCPYGSIHIVPADQVDPEASLPLLQQILRAFKKAPAAAAKPEAKQGSRYPVKCDLCHTLPYQACVKHCPTGAVFRIEGSTQFGHALEKPASAGPQANRPSGETTTLYVQAKFPHAPTAKRPGELEVVLARKGPGVPIRCRQPEQGVAEFKLNFFLVAPDDWRIGGGGPVRQLTLRPDRPAGAVQYPVTSPSPGEFELKLAVYQGGLYLGRVPVACQVEKPAPPAPRPAAGAEPGAAAAGPTRPTKAPKTLPPKKTDA